MVVAGGADPDQCTPKPFQLWRPGLLDAVRSFLLSENLQSGAQLAIGVLFVSLFVFVDGLRFPGSCLAVLLYMVVAVTAAPDCHIGTRIFICGFMLGPMWISLLVGGIIGTLGKLAPTPEGQLLVLCILGPLALVPFAINRVGTNHLFMWAMGMVSCLYMGMPIIAGWPIQDLATFWTRAVGFVLVAALIGMFAGTVLSMIVMPSLASYQVEGEVSAALISLGHHLSHATSVMFRRREPSAPLPPQFEGLHPLLHKQDEFQPGALAPGLLDRDLTTEVSPRDVYMAVMDWFEHLSRPPSDSEPRTRLACVSTCGNTVSSDAGSERHKATFYGSTAGSLTAAAAAVAAAAAADCWDDNDLKPDAAAAAAASTSVQDHAPSSSPFQEGSAADNMSSSSRLFLPSFLTRRGKSSSAAPAAAFQKQDVQPQMVSTSQHRSGSTTAAAGAASSHPVELRLGSTVNAAAVAASKTSTAAAGATATGWPAAPGANVVSFEVTDTSYCSAIAAAAAAAAGGGGGGGSGGDVAPAGYVAAGRPLSFVAPSQQQQQPFGVPQPVPSITDIRQLLAHSNQLLDAAGAEPQWLRGPVRRFEAPKWAKLVAAAQLLAMRLSGLDLVNQDVKSLLDESHSFEIMGDLEVVLKTLYSSAAAAVALLAQQLGQRADKGSTCAARQQLLQSPGWQELRCQLLQLLEASLAVYYVKIHQASQEAPVMLPSGHWVRRWMFFITCTVSVMDALEQLAEAAEAALAPTPVKPAQATTGLQPQQQHHITPKQQHQEQQEQQEHAAASHGHNSPPDIEAGGGNPLQAEGLDRPASHTDQGSSAGGISTTIGQQQQQQQPQQQGGPLSATPAAPALLTSLQSMVPGDQSTAAAATAAADIAAGPPGSHRPGSQPASLSVAAGVAPTTPTAGVAESAPSPTAKPAAATAVGGAEPPPSAAAGTRHGNGKAHVKASFKKHTAWIRPWLPLALNLKQFENWQLVFTQDVPVAFGSWQGFKQALKSRRVQAGAKYWAVLTIMLVGLLVLQFQHPQLARYGPSFGYSAAAVGMSDRVEATVFKVAIWAVGTVVGAAMGWGLMAHASIALNNIALAAVLCAVAFSIGLLDRSKDTLITLYTLTTIASVVLCQCCGHLGSTTMAIVRGSVVAVAAVVAVAVQNLILPWYTSTWATEQLGIVFKESTELLADLVCQVYEDTEDLRCHQQPYQQQHQQQDGKAAAATAAVHSSSGGSSSSSGIGSPQSAAAAATTEGASGTVTQSAALRRLQQLDEAVRRVRQREQQQQQQQQLQNQRQSSLVPSIGPRLAGLGHMFTSTSSSRDLRLLQPSVSASQLGASPAVAAVPAAAAASTTTANNAGRQSSSTAATALDIEASTVSGPPEDSRWQAASADAAASARSAPSSVATIAVDDALAAEGVRAGHAALEEMLVLLHQRRQKQQHKHQQQPSGLAAGSRVIVTGPQLQLRLVRPLIQVKISLILDTTAWRSGLFATPPLVLRLMRLMFDLVDALAALQQAVSMPVQQLSGSWDWTLMHKAGVLAALLMAVMALADATAAHLMEPSQETARQLLAQVQNVQHKRFEFFALQRELRRLLHLALATEPQLFDSCFSGDGRWQLQGQLRYCSTLYATTKVIDRMTAVARCALDAYNQG